LRGCVGVSIFFGFKFGLTLLPLTLHAILTQTNVFWTSILSVVFLKDRIQTFEYLAIPLAFLGVVAMIFNKGATSSQDYEISERLIGIIIVLLGTWGLSLNFIINRKLANVHWSYIMLVYALVGIFVSLFFIIVDTSLSGFKIHSLELYGLLFLTAIAAFLQIFSQIIAF